jgi:hypothetical protein
MIQQKKNPNDPDASDLNPEIVRIANRNGFLRGFISMYLHGQLTWQETLENMVVTMMKEYDAQGQIMVDALQDVILLGGNKSQSVLAYGNSQVPTLPERGAVPS